MINDPRNPYDTLYTVDRLGNVHGGLSVRCMWSESLVDMWLMLVRGISDVNAPTESLEDAVIACIKADQPVFFGQ